MGRKKTYVSSTVVSMVTDSPNIIQQSVVTSIAQGTDIGQDIVTNLTSGLASKMLTYYRVGKLEEPNVDLIPSSRGSIYTTSIMDVEYTLEKIHGPVDIIECRVEPLDTDYLAYAYMSEKYGYNYTDGSFKSLPNNLPIASTTFFNSSHYGGYLVIEYSNALKEVVYSETTSVPVTATQADWYHVVFNLTGSKEVMYWNYDTSTRKYPYLNISDYGIEHNYYPVVPIIRYGKNLTEDETTKKFKVCRRLCKLVGMDYVDLSDSLKESKDYKNIEQANFVPCVRIKDNNELALKYLFYFFSLREESSYTSKETIDNWSAYNTFATPPRTSERFISDAFKADVTWMYIKRTIVNGSWKFGEAEYGRNVRPNLKITYGGKGVKGTKTYVKPTEYNYAAVVYYRKISNKQYEEVVVHDLVHTNYVDNKYSVTTRIKDMFKGGEDDPEAVFFPISPQLAQEIFPTLVERNTFMYRTFNLVLSFKVTVKLKWYQTSFFQFAMIVVAIALTIYSMGAFAESVAAAYAAGGITAAATTAFALVFFSVGTSIALQYLLEQYGVGVTAIVAVLLIAVVGGTYGADISIGSAEFSIFSFVNNAIGSFTDYFKEQQLAELDKQQDILAEQNEWFEEYNAMMSSMFELSDSFAEAYKGYVEDQAMYNRMTPSTFIFVAIDMLTLAPELQDAYIDNFVDSALTPTTEYDVL